MLYIRAKDNVDYLALPVLTSDVLARCEQWYDCSSQDRAQNPLNPSNQAESPYKLNHLYWPVTGASRFASGSFVVDSYTLGLLRVQLDYALSNEVTLSYYDDKDANPDEPGREYPLYLISSRPVSRTVDGPFPTEEPKEDNLWIIELVDQRWYWANSTGVLVDDPSVVPADWATVFKSIFDQLEVYSYFTDTIPAAYGAPGSDWTGLSVSGSSCAYLLDLAARQVGARVVVTPGEISIQIPNQANFDALTVWLGNQYLDDRVSGGGELDDTDVMDTLNAGAGFARFVMADGTELYSTLPTGVPSATVLASLSLPDDAVEADYQAALDQWGQDWYDWRYAPVTTTLSGFLLPPNSGFLGSVEIYHDAKTGYTRINRPLEEYTIREDVGAAAAGDPGCPVWYTEYHHLEDLAVSVGARLAPGQLIGTLASIPVGAHSHFSLCDGGRAAGLEFLDTTPGAEVVCGQSLDIDSWLPWAKDGVRAAVSPPLYDPPIFEGTTDQAAAVKYIRSVFAPWITGDPALYTQQYGSTEHYGAEYYAVDVYPAGVSPSSHDESMAGTPVYLAITNEPIAFNVISTVIFAGKLNDTVHKMVIVKHTACPEEDVFDLEITAEYDADHGYEWKQIALDRSPQDGFDFPNRPKGFVDVAPEVTGKYLFEVQDNRMLVAGTRVRAKSIDIGWEFVVPESFYATIVAPSTGPVFSSARGYYWTYGSLSGKYLYEINSNENMQPGDVVWVHRRPGNSVEGIDLDTPPKPQWLADRPHIRHTCGFAYYPELDEYYVDPGGFVDSGSGLIVTYPPPPPPGYPLECPKLSIDPTYPYPEDLGCGLEKDLITNKLQINLTDVVSDPLVWTDCALELNLGCGLTLDGGTGALIVDAAALAGSAAATALVTSGDCEIGVDLVSAATTDETLVTNVSQTFSGGMLCISKTTQVYRNYFNEAGLHVYRAPYGSPVTATSGCIDFCLQVACCTADPLVANAYATATAVDTCPATPVTFTSGVTGGISTCAAGYTYQWDFGDGIGTSNVANPPAYTFTTEGVFTAIVTVTDCCGNVAFGTAPPITVTDPCSVGGRTVLAPGVGASCPAMPTLTWELDYTFNAVVGLFYWYHIVIPPMTDLHLNTSAPCAAGGWGMDEFYGDSGGGNTCATPTTTNPGVNRACAVIGSVLNPVDVWIKLHVNGDSCVRVRATTTPC